MIIAKSQAAINRAEQDLASKGTIYEKVGYFLETSMVDVPSSRGLHRQECYTYL